MPLQLIARNRPPCEGVPGRTDPAAWSRVRPGSYATLHLATLLILGARFVEDQFVTVDCERTDLG